MMPGNFPSLQTMTQAEAFAWAMAPTPGIRLTLTQNLPITTADVTGATSIYAEPLNGGVVPLFQDTAGIYPCIRKLSANSLSLALGTLASATIPNDVFAYNNNGAVGLEKLAWTNTTTRATAVDLVNGRFYKNGDYSRLLVASFAPTATTTTEDSAAKRQLFNVYNRRARLMSRNETTSHTINNTVQEWNGGTAARMLFMTGLAEDTVTQHVDVTVSALAVGAYAVAYPNMNGTADNDQRMAINASGVIACSLTPSTVFMPPVGSNYLTVTEQEVNSQNATMFQVYNRGQCWA